MRTFYFQPIFGVIIGWLLGWGIRKIISVISFFIFLTICFSFFDVQRYWEVNEKREKKSVQI
jgi:uncharacterized membrane protein (Fun14 family)